MYVKGTITRDGVLEHKFAVRLEPDDPLIGAIESMTEGFKYVVIGLAVVAAGYVIGVAVGEYRKKKK